MKFKIFAYLLYTSILTVITVKVNAQKYSLDTVIITSNLIKQPLLTTPNSAIAINKKEIETKEFNGFLPILNSISGVRMEERSPGSYRLAIRGSALRAPFGIRNVKIYLDDFPLTDATGNTYLNLIPANAIEQIEILKGPDGSLFGANSAGVLILKSLTDNVEKNINVQAGSFGNFREHLKVQDINRNINYKIFQEYSQSDGYRNHSALKRIFVQNSNQYNYSKSNFLKLTAFYSKLWYETPGGLNITQYEMNPKMSRPATSTIPSAEEQNASIDNKTAFIGIANQMKLAENLSHHINFSGIITNFSNPFITNYETRLENTVSIRTYLKLNNHIFKNKNVQFFVGYEYQNTFSDIKNFKNLAGNRGEYKTGDKVNTQQQFIFSKTLISISNNIKTELGLSLNFYKYQFKNLVNENLSKKETRNFNPELMPRFALSYLVNQNFAIRGTVSRGFSTPSLSEIRASDAVINTNLNAERGTNYELGFRINSTDRDFYVDIAAFTYQLKDAIIKQNKSADIDFFTNVGSNAQKGLETQISYDILHSESSFLKFLQFQCAFTLSHFKFTNYQYKVDNYSGNSLPGIPEKNFSNQLFFTFKNNISIATNYQFLSQIPLNDANTTFSKSYHILQCKTNWIKNVGRKYAFTFFAGADNILNQKYSLGNDINAFGGRYYNAAASRNYFAGIGFQIK